MLLSVSHYQKSRKYYFINLWTAGASADFIAFPLETRQRSCVCICHDPDFIHCSVSSLLIRVLNATQAAQEKYKVKRRCVKNCKYKKCKKNFFNKKNIQERVCSSWDALVLVSVFQHWNFMSFLLNFLSPSCMSTCIMYMGSLSPELLICHFLLLIEGVVIELIPTLPCNFILSGVNSLC